jgi:hypothetical protein
VPAQAQETHGKFFAACESYGSALAAAETGSSRTAGGDSPSGKPELVRVCRGGLARCQIRLGDFAGGADLAAAVGGEMLLQECAAILEDMQQAQVSAS